MIHRVYVPGLELDTVRIKVWLGLELGFDTVEEG